MTSIPKIVACPKRNTPWGFGIGADSSWNPLRSGSADRARLGDVLADLVLQVLRAGEGPRGPESLEKIEFEGLAVEVPFEVDQVGLNLAGRLAEGGIRTDVAGTWVRW